MLDSMSVASAPVDRFIDALVDFIQHELSVSTRALDADTYLFDGVIDSLKILRLIAFVENWTGRTIPDRDVVMKNFRSVRTIAERFVVDDAR
jgi:acyl carrier protein